MEQLRASEHRRVENSRPLWICSDQLALEPHIILPVPTALRVPVR